MTFPQPYGSLNRYFLNRSTHVLKEVIAVYLNNAKCGCASLGMPLDSTPSFSDFVDLVGAATNDKDQHLRPQTENIYVGHVSTGQRDLDDAKTELGLTAAIELGSAFIEQLITLIANCRAKSGTAA